MRLFALAEALRRGFEMEAIYRITLIDKFFLGKIKRWSIPRMPWPVRRF
jgi:hypothetical protein